VREELLAHEIVALNHALQVVLVDADGDAHEQVLRALHDEVLDAKQVAEYVKCEETAVACLGVDARALKRLETKVVESVVAGVHDCRIELPLVGHDDAVAAVGLHRLHAATEGRESRRDTVGDNARFFADEGCAAAGAGVDVGVQVVYDLRRGRVGWLWGARGSGRTSLNFSLVLL